MGFGNEKKMLNIQVEPRMCMKTQGLIKTGPPKHAFSTGGFVTFRFRIYGHQRVSFKSFCPHLKTVPLYRQHSGTRAAPSPQMALGHEENLAGAVAWHGFA